MTEFTASETAGLILVPIIFLILLVTVVILGIRRCRLKTSAAKANANVLRIS